ncbi:agamous-like MADS-box protein AGL62 [Pyrus x bretschneideri]|uniref:agamous-like MADS-box protein AGL62 n=1 Tax=Pyrus x bretschneideri TaxID=225117 RepID=UPI00202EEDAA|nr:agamous-like MADS-box protein AGL62 [Pyrus x bretschneideri]
MPGIISTALPNKKSVQRKLVIKKIEKPNSLLVSFSKRRGGLFRKACQLSGLCGAEVAVIVFSPCGRLYVFGHPSADSVLSRLERVNNALHGRQYISMHASSEDEDHDTDSSINESNSIESCMVSKTSIDLENLVLDLEKDTEEMEEDEASKFWWDQPIETVKKLDELKQFKSSLDKLKAKVITQLDEMEMRKLVVRHYLM